ncbi:uncharacterized protein [Heptranchias perlo]|uniref:uncharacterized protein isoform X2 n=1 Tax=Heptranchias perlo TaxID=212740 RepID=UPI00355A2320
MNNVFLTARPPLIVLALHRLPGSLRPQDHYPSIATHSSCNLSPIHLEYLYNLLYPGLLQKLVRTAVVEKGDPPQLPQHPQLGFGLE